MDVSHGAVRSRESPAGDGEESAGDAVDPDARRARRGLVGLVCAVESEKRATGGTSGTSGTGQTRAKFNFLPLPAFSEAAGVVSTACIERPLVYRGGSASTEIMPVTSPSPCVLVFLFTGRLVDPRIRASKDCDARWARLARGA